MSTTLGFFYSSEKSHWERLLSITEWEMYTSLLKGPRFRNDLYCVEWDVKLYYIIPLTTLTHSLIHSLIHNNNPTAVRVETGVPGVLDLCQYSCSHNNNNNNKTYIAPYSRNFRGGVNFRGASRAMVGVSFYPLSCTCFKTLITRFVETCVYHSHQPIALFS